MTLAIAPQLIVTLLIGCQSAPIAEPIRLLHIDGTERTAKGEYVITDTAFVSGEKSTPLTDLVRIDFPNRVRPARSIVFLTNDDELPLSEIRVEDESLIGQYADQSFTIPLEFVRAIALQLPESTSARRERLRVVRQSSEQDTIVLNNDDQIVGELQSLDKTSVTIDSAAGSRNIPTKLVRSIRFSKELQSPVPKDGRAAIVQTSDGFVVTVKQLRSNGEIIELRTVTGTPITVATSKLHAIQLLHSRLAYLTDLPPSASRHIPYLGRERKWKVNRNIDGGVARHLDRRYVRAIGTTSRSEISWQLNGTYGSFHTALGLDDSAERGAAVFEVQLDGKTIFTSKSVRSKQGLSRTPAIDVLNAKRLTLIVDYGPRGDMQDVANWVDPVLIRAER